MAIKRFDHVTINVRNLDASICYYQDLVGLMPLSSVDMSDHKLFYFQIPDGGKLELVCYHYETHDPGKEATATDLGKARHLAFEVDNVYEMEKRLTEAGFCFHVPVSYVEQLGFSGGLTLDPNGFEIEFLQYGKA